MYKLIPYGTAWRIVRSLEGPYKSYKEAKLALLDLYELEDDV